MDTLIASILEKISTTTEPIIIGISGHGAAGKTTLALSLIETLGKHKVNYLNTDPYILDSSIRKYTTIEYDYIDTTHKFKMTACHPEAHFIPALERDLSMIRNGLLLKTIDVPYLPQTTMLPEKSITIVEGMSVAFIDPELIDLSIYLHTDDDTEWVRRTNRDVSERNTTLSYLTNSHAERRIQYTIFMHPFSKSFNIIVRQTITDFQIEKNH
ncbi:phosphoribulokinase [Marinilactibacillus sp. XAAS-LB27]|uniref:uridine kinase family protein n=1 Tax=Marinilactibacillus sp. XAAS-LB27 TaxID=3114538 RepID=UPI002E178C96|nr:phosphoribulokinase [Marinilactibacillus sp. XAAS-LB27]